MVESKGDQDVFNPKSYTIEPAARCKYKKLANVGTSHQKALVNTDRKEAVIKFFKIPADLTKDQLPNCYTEARVLLKYPHPNIIRVRDVFKDKGEIGTAFEFIQGATISDRLKQTDKPLTEDECLDYFTQIVVAFKELHEGLIMHKNIAAEHFLLKDRGSANKIVKIIGFSQLREMLHVNSVTRKKEEDETAYVPPETMAGGNYTRPADIWGLGILLSQMANMGVSTLPTDDSQDLVAAIKAGKHRQVPAGFSKEFVDILDSCLQVVPEERATINALVHEVLLERVKKYITSEDFKEEWIATRLTMILMNDEYKLFQCKLTMEQIEQELKDYIHKTTDQN